MITLFGAIYAAASSGLSAIGEAKLHALAEESDAQGTLAKAILARVETLRARLVVGRFASIVLVTFVLVRAAGLRDLATLGTWLAGGLLAYGLIVEVASAIVRQRGTVAGLRAIRLARPLELFISPLALPAVAVRALAARFVAEVPEEHAAQLTALAVEHMIDEGEEEGTIDEGHAEMLRSLLDFRDTVAREVMVPRPRVVAFRVDAAIAEVLERVVSSGHSRFPVYGSSEDQVEGVVYAKDLFNAVPQGEGDAKGTLREVMRTPVFVVQESSLIGAVLAEMQRRRSHLAIVKDEFGATAGIITIEDILEEIVGEIQDEYDSDEDVARVSEVTPGHYIVDGAYLVDDLEESLGADLRRGASSDTVGGLCVEVRGTLPEAGDEIVIGAFVLSVEEVDAGRVSRVRVRPADEAEISGEVPTAANG